MKKLSLELDLLDVQTLETSPAGDGERGTVLGMQEGGYPESDTCASFVHTCVSCETYDGTCGDDGAPDAGRRIIVYQTTS